MTRVYSVSYGDNRLFFADVGAARRKALSIASASDRTVVVEMRIHAVRVGVPRHKLVEMLKGRPALDKHGAGIPRPALDVGVLLLALLGTAEGSNDANAQRQLSHRHFFKRF